MPDVESLVVDGARSEALVLAPARALARAISDSAPFRAFDAAQQALLADAELTRRLHRYQSREGELGPARAHGGADPRAQDALEVEWRSLWELPVARAFLQAQEDLEAFLEAVAQAITEAAGVDYPAACGPAGGCCS